MTALSGPKFIIQLEQQNLSIALMTESGLFLVAFLRTY
jgi:hypothetical protein